VRGAVVVRVVATSVGVADADAVVLRGWARDFVGRAGCVCRVADGSGDVIAVGSGANEAPDGVPLAVTSGCAAFDDGPLCW
jgi:hypothetical protein